MTPKQQGRFCDVCAKCVVDMTKKSPVEMKEIYDEKDGNVCVRVWPSQLKEVEIVAETTSFPMNMLNKLQKFAIAFAAAFGLLVSVHAQALPGPPARKTMGKMAVHHGPEVSGYVKYDDGSPAVDVKIQILSGTRVVNETQTNPHGYYSMRNLSKGDFVIKVIELGTVRFEHKIRFDYYSRVRKGFVLEREVILEIEEMMMGDMMMEEAVFEELPEQVEGELVEELEVETEVVKGDLKLESGMLGQVVIVEELLISEVTMGIMAIEPVILPVKELFPIPEIEELTEENSLLKNMGEEGQGSIVDENLEIKVYPNPTRDVVRVEWNVLGDEPFVLRILGMNGQVLNEKTIENGNEARIDLTGLPAGIYILEVDSKALNGKRKIVKL